jgi:hypothetical protein
MRWPLLAILAASTLLAANPARSQPPGGAGYGPMPHRPTHADSMRTLGGPRQVWFHAGVGWINAPSEVRQRYNAGIVVGVSGDRRLEDRLALRGRVEFQDFPSTQPNVVYQDGIAYPVNTDYGHGWQGSALGGAAMRVWNHFWLDGGYGVAYFNNGYGSQSYTDLVTGQVIDLHPTNGWGPIWSVGTRYEFKPSLRDRLLAEVEVYSMNRDGMAVRSIAIRMGYRGL